MANEIQSGYSSFFDPQKSKTGGWRRESGWGEKRSRRISKKGSGTSVERFFNSSNKTKPVIVSSNTSIGGPGTTYVGIMTSIKPARDFGRTVGTIAKRLMRREVRGINKLSTTISKPVKSITNLAGKSGRAVGKFGLGSLKGTRRIIKNIPSPIRKAGLAGGLIAGATAMLGLAVMKGAMNQSREIVYERYMQDQAVGKNILNNTRMGLASGTSRMQNMGSTMGLSNALSRTRHG